jgi:hypothetical protein
MLIFTHSWFISCYIYFIYSVELLSLSQSYSWITMPRAPRCIMICSVVDHDPSPSRGIPRRMPESMGILHPGTSFGVFWSTNVARTWYDIGMKNTRWFLKNLASDEVSLVKGIESIEYPIFKPLSMRKSLSIQLSKRRSAHRRQTGAMWGANLHVQIFTYLTLGWALETIVKTLGILPHTEWTKSLDICMPYVSRTV